MKKNNKVQPPFFVVLFAAYPVVTLLATNAREVNLQIITRPLLASLLFGLVLWGVLYLIQKNPIRSALNATVVLFFFFSYGGFYQQVRYYEFLNAIGGPHVPIIILTLGGLFITLRWIHKTNNFTNAVKYLNLIGAFFLLYPLAQIGYFIYQKESPTPIAQTSVQTSSNSPDIYYIILDGYSRADTFEYFGYDNSKFYKDLEAQGFYVATCSRSNYQNTLLSLTSSLNMDFVYNAVPNAGGSDANVEPVYHALQYNKVRADLKQRGYQIISFKTGYEWDEWRDADQFLYPALEENPAMYPAVLPFEYLLMQTTALRPFLDNGFLAQERFLDQYHRTFYILDQLPRVASQPGPKFVYVHMLVPHAPFIFMPDGSLNPDRSFYITEAGIGEDEDTILKGYLNNIAFISERIIPVLEKIKANSAQPPIIIVQGDHGYVSEERKYNNLNAYYLPGDAQTKLYPTITPVNSFRLIFNEYFGTEYELRPDKSIGTDPGRPYRQRVEPPFPAECP